MLLRQYHVWVCTCAYMLYIHKQVCYFHRFIYLVKFLSYQICLFQIFERLSRHSLSSCLKLAFFFLFTILGSHGSKLSILAWALSTQPLFAEYFGVLSSELYPREGVDTGSEGTCSFGFLDALLCGERRL